MTTTANARGNVVQPREAVRVMAANGGGAVVSVAFLTQAAYAASKGAIGQLTRVIAVEYGKQGVRANAVLLGVVNTDVMVGVVDNGRKMLASFGDQHPIGRNRAAGPDGPASSSADGVGARGATCGWWIRA